MSADELKGMKDVFAYPFGLYSNENLTLLKGKGFQLAFTCQNGKNKKDIPPLLLKRNAVPYFMDLQVFQDLVKWGRG